MRLGTSNRQYIFTPALRTELRLAYAQPKNARASAITVLKRKTGWPRHVFRLEAQRMDLITSPRRPWTEEEDRVLENALGEASIWAIAKRLRRTHESVKARSERLEMSIWPRSGYCIADLSKILGAPRYRVYEWIEKGLFGAPEEEIPDGDFRVKDEALTHFIRNNPTLIDFRLADQTFIKRVLCVSKERTSRHLLRKAKTQ